MARGWESKSVEQQQSEMVDASGPKGPRLSPDQQKRARQREGLLLSRARLLREIENATHPEHRRMLEEAAAELSRQLSSFEEDSEHADT